MAAIQAAPSPSTGDCIVIVSGNATVPTVPLDISQWDFIVNPGASLTVSNAIFAPQNLDIKGTVDVQSGGWISKSGLSICVESGAILKITGGNLTFGDPVSNIETNNFWYGDSLPYYQFPPSGTGTLYEGEYTWEFQFDGSTTGWHNPMNP